MVTPSSIFIYNSPVSAEYGHEVEVSGSLFLDPKSHVKLEWNPNILPYSDPQSYSVDILLYEIDEMEGLLSTRYVLKQDINNTGSDEVEIPALDNAKTAVPVVIKVAESATSSNRRRRQAGSDSPLSGVWSGIFIGSTASSAINSISLRISCNSWTKSENEQIGSTLLENVIPCPPRLEQARLPNSGLTEVNLTSVFGPSSYNRQYQLYLHQNTTVCFQQRARSVMDVQCDELNTMINLPQPSSLCYLCHYHIMAIVHHTTELSMNTFFYNIILHICL